jgi:hypothetical protein
MRTTILVGLALGSGPYGPCKSRIVAALQSASLPGFRRRWRRAVVAFGLTAPLALASAAAPSGLRPVVAAPDAPQRYAAWRMTEGLEPERLACDVVWPEALLCLRVWEDGGRRWASTRDLERWGIGLPAARASLAEAARTHVESAPLVPIEGMAAKYLRLADGDGWAAAGLLRPDLLAERLGGLPLRVAIPSQGVMVAWRAQGPEVDKVMAVGVRELFEQQPQPVTPKVYQWDGARWAPFGEAVPDGGGAKPAPAPEPASGERPR